MSQPVKFETIERCEFAVRRYKQLVQRPLPRGSNLLPIRDIRVWLADDVSPVVEDFAKRPTFREFASWPLRTLADETNTPERLLVRAVDAALVACAKTLTDHCAEPSIRRKLVELNPPKQIVIDETVEIRSNRQRRSRVRRKPVDVLSIELAQVAEIAKRRWDDLVSVDDYFEPRQEWNESADGNRVQRGEFIVSMNSELHPLGNFVVRCLRQRVEGMYGSLAAVRRKYLAVLAGNAGNQDSQKLTAFHSQWEQLEVQKAKLYECCFTGRDNVLRDSCMILTQVYAAFHLKPDVQWLGLPPAVVQEGIGAIRVRLQGFQGSEVTERIAAALGDLPKLYEDGAPDLSAREEAIASGCLVIDEGQGKVFWEGRPLAKPSKGRSWDFFVALAKKARRRSPVTERDIFEDAQSDSTMSTTCNRLKNELPPTLRKLIGHGEEPRSYRLDLEPHRIYIFDKSR